MEELLRDLLLVVLAAGAVLVLFHRLRLPAVVGLLVAGVLIGPHGLGLLEESENVARLAELGILLLMFSIGLDFTPERLRELRRAAGMGLWQMLLCIAVTTGVAAPLTGSWPTALLLGFLVAHTSSTLMLKLFLDRGELTSPAVRLGVGISVTQDLSAVPMLLAVPMLAGGGGGASEFGLAILKLVAVLALAMALARWVIPFWLRYVVESRSRELFLVFLIVVCLGTAWATLAAGLSFALGALLAGLAIAASPYSHQMLAEVVAPRDLLISVFFISTGMLLDVRAMGTHLGAAALATAAVVVLKFSSGFLPTLLTGYPTRIAVMVGLAMAQIGEFGFVLAHAGLAAGLLSDELFRIFVMVALATMLLNPFLVAAGPRVSGWLEGLSWVRALAGRRRPVEPSGAERLESHVVVAGYGHNGRTLAQALSALGIPHTVLDLDPRAVRLARERGESVVFGDCTRTEVLRGLHLESARVYVVAISDREATRRTVQIARQQSPALHIVARTKYVAEIDLLRRLGANEVIAEEFETALDILSRTLAVIEVPHGRIEDIVQRFREDAYEALREQAPPGPAG